MCECRRLERRECVRTSGGCVNRADHARIAVWRRDELLAEEPDRDARIRDCEVPGWEARGHSRRNENGARVETLRLQRVAGTAERRLGHGVVARTARENGQRRKIGKASRTYDPPNVN